MASKWLRHCRWGGRLAPAAPRLHTAVRPRRCARAPRPSSCTAGRGAYASHTRRGSHTRPSAARLGAMVRGYLGNQARPHPSTNPPLTSLPCPRIARAVGGHAAPPRPGGRFRPPAASRASRGAGVRRRAGAAPAHCAGSLRGAVGRCVGSSGARTPSVRSSITGARSPAARGRRAPLRWRGAPQQGARARGPCGPVESLHIPSYS